MPLPLLMAAGAGILGGGRYLLEKQNEKRMAAQSEAASGMLSQYFNGPGAMYGQHDPQAAAGAALQVQADPSQLGSIIQNLEQRRVAIPGQISQQDLAAEALEFSNYNTVVNELESDLTKQTASLSATQNAYKRGIEAFKGGTAADAIAALYATFQTMEPNGRITESEQGALQGHGGISNQFASMINKIKGGGLTNPTRQEFLNTLAGIYKPFYEQGQAIKATTNKRIENARARGVNVMDGDVFGSAGYDFEYGPQTVDISGKGPAVDNPQRGGPELDLVDFDPNAKPVKNKSVRSVRRGG